MNLHDNDRRYAWYLNWVVHCQLVINKCIGFHIFREFMLKPSFYLHAIFYPNIRVSFSVIVQKLYFALISSYRIFDKTDYHWDTLPEDVDTHWTVNSEQKLTSNRRRTEGRCVTDGRRDAA